MFEKINKHMRGQSEIPEECFERSQENEFQIPTLEQEYWSSPNRSKGTICTCKNLGNIYFEKKHEEGI